ncbi:SusD/RagB family nutrient-binding outer membrane lipoprotein [Cecembia rubra]|uniref:SusD/RagB-like outer membrane lipoprotein n=1 Tax=Cecembia rubra TaxID=1485585 RepID=A0A2P8E0Z1_9BACT|nr:SusD/RagB family nutrient-binding outer membrane lipoprotein [Cecembia rubra]PSL03077.1 SusD/RagB-like outer membrane lipoprotein [Cecembia rubra]
MKRILYSLFTALSLLVVSACDLDLQDDPNAVTRDTANPDLVLNRIQLDFPSHFDGTSFYGMRLTRMMSQPNNLYEQAYIPVNFNGIWTNSYANLLNDIKFLEDIATERNFQRHLGIARTLKAYILMNLVDWFGDIPYSEALNPNNFNPKLDNGSAVYAEALAILDQAAANFTATPSAGTPQDLYYNRDYTKWRKLINTLKLRAHLNLKLTNAAGSATAINSLIADGNLIGNGDDFVFRFGTNFTDPASQHPYYNQYNNGGGGEYHSTWYMFHLTQAKGFDDPRARYYLYRQRIANPTDPDQLRCISEIAPGHYLAGGWPFCLPGNRGYWGRDHLNAEGIPPDGPLRTQWGVYPIGGRFDNDANVSVTRGAGANGAGIWPIMMASYVDFMRAEAALTITGVNGNPRELLESGIRKSMNFVRSFSVASSGTNATAIQAWQNDAAYSTSINNYVNFVVNEWNAAPNNDRRMNLIGREYWLALFGNGNEAYNLYRRTGKPDNMQPGLLESFGVFPRSLPYPNNHAVTNNNSQPKAGLNVRVFWDNNPIGTFPTGIY